MIALRGTCTFGYLFMGVKIFVLGHAVTVSLLVFSTLSLCVVLITKYDQNPNELNKEFSCDL